MERFTPDEPIFDRIELFQAPERLTRAVRFIFDRLYADVPAQPNIAELREEQ